MSGFCAMRMIAARRSPSSAENRCTRLRAVGSICTRWPSAASRATARSTAAGSVAKPAGAYTPICQWRSGALACILTSCGEKTGQQHTAFLRAHAADDGGVVIQPPLLEQIDNRTARAGLRIARAINDPCDPRMKHRACAHRARLERRVQRAIDETVIA